ncbi:MAG: hypothetical protein M0T81_09635 [Thermoplasmatales archaeon]|nr:hypothetical protein [Thermoplasmatales archaeon]
MPTIRVTEDTLKELERIADEFKKLKRTGFESLFKITPDIVIKQLIDDWDATEKEDLITFEKNQAYREEQANKEKKGKGK